MNECMDARAEGEPEMPGEAALPQEGQGSAWAGCPVTAADIDEAVSEVFHSMMGIVAIPNEHRRAAREHISAMIQLSGSRDGRCTVEMPQEAGDWLTDSLMGSEADWDDDMIHDAVGELCNIITGGIKRRLGEWLGECRISLPQICRSRPHELDSAASSAIRRLYSVGTTTLVVTLAFYPVSYRTTD